MVTSFHAFQSKLYTHFSFPHALYAFLPSKPFLQPLVSSSLLGPDTHLIKHIMVLTVTSMKPAEAVFQDVVSCRGTAPGR